MTAMKRENDSSKRDKTKFVRPIGECAEVTGSTITEFAIVAIEMNVAPAVVVPYYTEADAFAVSQEIVRRLREQRDRALEAVSN